DKADRIEQLDVPPVEMVRKVWLEREFSDLEGPMHPDPRILCPFETTEGQIDRRTAMFGDFGRLAIGDMRLWPTDLEESFEADGRFRDLTDGGPVTALRNGLATWFQHAFSPYGQQLVCDLLLTHSPRALAAPANVARLLVELPDQEALCLADLLAR